MTTELMISPRPAYDLGETMELGNVLAKSGFFADTREAAQAVTKILAGRELGIGPIAAMTGVYIVNGRIAIGANLMAAAVKRSGKYDYRIIEMTDKVCKIVFLQAGQQVGESIFTLEDAKRAGTKNIDKFPRNMLFARALSNGVRWFAPDVFDATVYTPDELRAGTDGEAHEPQRPPTPPADAATGEVLDAAPPVAVSGVVEGQPNTRFSPDGALGVNFKVTGRNYLLMNAAPELAYLDAGDEVELLYHVETIKGKPYNVVDTLTGATDADGNTPWVARAARGSTFDPIEDAEPVAA